MTCRRRGYEITKIGCTQWIFSCSCIDKASNIHNNVEIGEGVTILGNSSIFGYSKIGNHVLLNNSTSLNHDNHFSKYSSTGPGVITSGDVKVGESSYIGINSCIKPDERQNKLTSFKCVLFGIKSYLLLYDIASNSSIMSFRSTE